MIIRIAVLLFAALTAATAFAVDFELLNIQEIGGNEQFQKTRVGGLSGIVWDASATMLWAVSDDRGRIDEPRLYGFQLNEKDHSLKLTKMIPLKDPKTKTSIYDFEGLSLLPWGNFLISSEGDMNHKPREQARLMEFKTTGEFVRDYQLPTDYLAEKSGQQTKGPRNNFGLEGLGAHASGNMWVLALELPLIQDKSDRTRLLEFTQPEAWVLRSGREWSYPLRAPNEQIQINRINGISEIMHVKDNVWWVLERGVTISLSGMEISAQIFSVELGSSTELKKTLVLNLKEFGAKSAASAVGVAPRFLRNYEAMAWGPDLADGRKRLFIVSDNNLETKTKTQILSLAVKL